MVATDVVGQEVEGTCRVAREVVEAEVERVMVVSQNLSDTIQT